MAVQLNALGNVHLTVPIQQSSIQSIVIKHTYIRRGNPFPDRIKNVSFYPIPKTLFSANKKCNVKYFTGILHSLNRLCTLIVSFSVHWWLFCCSPMRQSENIVKLKLISQLSVSQNIFQKSSNAWSEIYDSLYGNTISSVYW